MRKCAIIIVRIGVTALVAVTLCAAGLVLYSRSQGLLIMSVQTGSMRPAIRPGDAVVVRQSSVLDTLKPGDIISYRSPRNSDVILTHRLVAVDTRTGLLTARGDAAAAADPPFGQDRVVGMVTRTVPLAGGVLDFVRQPYGLATAVYAPSIMLITWEIRRLMRSYASQHYSVHYY